MDLPPKQEFLEQHDISEEKFEESGCEWEEIQAIHDDYVGRVSELRKLADYIASRYRAVECVHSVRSRVKKPGRLIDKVIRKNDGDRQITVDNYRSEITDLIGIRALLLYKHEWVHVADFTDKNWEPHEGPVANIREGDDKTFYRNDGCKIEENERGYRSVHYVVPSQSGKETHYVEVQIRTLLEEAWSEIDHEFRYSAETGEALVGDFLEVFNRLLGTADELATFLTNMTQRISKLEEERTKRSERIKELEAKIEELDVTDEEKEGLTSLLPGVAGGLSLPGMLHSSGRSDLMRRAMALQRGNEYDPLSRLSKWVERERSLSDPLHSIQEENLTEKAQNRIERLAEQDRLTDGLCLRSTDETESNSDENDE